MFVIATHDVDDAAHWQGSPERDKFAEPPGLKFTAFVDPAGESNSVALLIETPDTETLQKALAERAAAEAQAADGVHADTIQLYTAG